MGFGFVARKWWLRGVTGVVLAWCTASAFATDVRFVGAVGYSAIAPFALLHADQISNFGSSASAPLRMELWATPAPFAGSFAGGYQTAAYPVSALAAGASITNVDSPAVTFTLPPSGNWYVAMVLTEYTGQAGNGGYTARNWLTFPDLMVGSGGPPPPDTTPPTASISSPTGGTVSGTVTVSVAASDNVGVTRVDLQVNGTTIASATSAPYQFSWNSASVPNGSAQLKAIAYDAASNAGPSAIVTVTVSNGPPPDTTPPTASIASPTGGTVSGTVAVSVNASDNVGVTRVDLQVNGQTIASDSSAPYQFSWNSTSVANGTAQLKAVAYDAAGNSGQSAIVSVTVSNVTTPPPDTTPPTASIASPTGGTVSGTVAVSVNASDNVGVTRVDLQVNGQTIASDSSAPYQFSWNSTSVANGTAQLKAVAYDAAGNSGQSAIVSVTVSNTVAPPPDTTPPTASIGSPTGGTVSGVVTISASASDNVGVTRVDLAVNGTVVASDNAAPWQLSWDSHAVADGTVQLKVIAYDAAGNSGASAPVTVTVANTVTPSPSDTTPPTVSIASPLGGQVSGVVSVSVNASDNVGVVRVQLTVNGQVISSLTSAPWQFAWDTRSAGNGSTQLKSIAYDAAGNSATSAAVTVNVHNTGRSKTAVAIEYYNASLDHYFISASQADIDALDSGRFTGWGRTGQSITVYASGEADGNPVCRFYLPPEYGDSHFFSASQDECAAVMARFPYFAYETPEAFRIALPDSVTGACPAGTMPVYRVWNDRADTNHRYTTSRLSRDQMLTKGYVAEGYGPDAVIMCSPQ